MAMTKSVTIVGIVGIALFFSAEAFAGLRWEQRRVEPGLRPSATAVEAGFAFRNVGDSQVTITGVRTSCGCTAAAAGEGGDA
jgi:hypothetical protein